MEDDVDVKTKLPKVAKVKNKMPAPVQITAEQLLREAKERELELVQPPPKQKISDEAELRDYRMRKRKAFEDNIRKNRTVIINWLKYASWEESQLELQRARSVYERSLDIDHRNIVIWLKYAEMEMRHRQINHARNVWDRAVTILPRANQFWYKYTYMEEMLGNISGARQVFERWIEWEPEEQAWHSYINFELRYKELDRARVIYEKFVIVHPEVKNWLKYAKFEEKNQFISSARRIYERAVEYFGDEHVDEHLLIQFAKFEETQREHDRARVIYKYALDRLPKEKCQEVYKQYTIHEKKFGDRTAIEDVIVSKRKFKYEDEVKLNPFNYDAWFDYLRLLEADGKVDDVREIYERAIANVPPSQEKRHWRRYIYLWIKYAIYEELDAKDIDRTRQVYQMCIEIIPHKRFTFAKVWLLFAHFEVRQKNLTTARKILGTAIGKCPKDKLFRGYIELELQLREFDRCRKLYEKFLLFSPENCTTWMKFAEMEAMLGDVDRARAVFELAIAQPKLDMPEVLWKAYIDFEMEQEEYDRTRGLYQRLLQRTKHVKVWLSYAQFEMSVGGDDFVSKARGVYRQSNGVLKECEEKEERLMLLEAWKEFELEHGDEQSLASVTKLMPNKVKRRRKIQTDTGADAGWEEYYDYIFPDDEAAQPNLKLLAMAKMWKKQADTTGGDNEPSAPAAGDDDDDESDSDVEHSPQDDAEVRNHAPDIDNGQEQAQSSSESSDSEEEEEGTGIQQNERDNGPENGQDKPPEQSPSHQLETKVDTDRIKVENGVDPDQDRDDSISSTSSESDSSDSETDDKQRGRHGEKNQPAAKRQKMVRPASSDSSSSRSPSIKREPSSPTKARKAGSGSRSSSSDAELPKKSAPAIQGSVKRSASSGSDRSQPKKSYDGGQKTVPSAKGRESSSSSESDSAEKTARPVNRKRSASSSSSDSSRSGSPPQKVLRQKERSPDARKPSTAARRRSSSSSNSSGDDKRRSAAKRGPSDRKPQPSPRRRSPSPAWRRSPSPKRRAASPRRRSPSPRRRSVSPRRRQPSPRRRRRSPSPRSRQTSSKQRSPSPRRKRSPSPRRRSPVRGQRRSKSRDRKR